MKLSIFPELNKSITNKDLYKEREKNLPENIQEIKNASEYFSNIRTLIDNNNYKTNIQNINTGHIHILNECIKFAENKRIINDRIDKGLNEKEFHRMTLDSGYDGIVGVAQRLVSAFFDPSINDEIRSDSKIGSTYLTRDAREQAYRICYYVLSYMESYAEDGSLVGKTRKGLMDVLS